MDLTLPFVDGYTFFDILETRLNPVLLNLVLFFVLIHLITLIIRTNVKALHELFHYIHESNMIFNPFIILKWPWFLYKFVISSIDLFWNVTKISSFFGVLVAFYYRNTLLQHGTLFITERIPLLITEHSPFGYLTDFLSFFATTSK